MYVFCWPCPSGTFALQNGGFVPREWLSCKGSIGLEKNKSSVRASRVSLTRPQGVCGERKKKRLSVFHTMSSF